MTEELSDKEKFKKLVEHQRHIMSILFDFIDINLYITNFEELRWRISASIDLEMELGLINYE